MSHPHRTTSSPAWPTWNDSSTRLATRGAHQGGPCPRAIRIDHPFLDGNGRLGRLLIAIILHHEKVLAQPLLYLSLYFKQHRDEYYRLLTEVRQHGMWEAWLDFFLEGVAHTASSAVETAHRLIRLFEGDAVRIQQLGRQAANGCGLSWSSRSTCDGYLLADRAVGISFPTASRILDSLKEVGIVRELTAGAETGSSPTTNTSPFSTRGPSRYEGRHHHKTTHSQ